MNKGDEQIKVDSSLEVNSVEKKKFNLAEKFVVFKRLSFVQKISVIALLALTLFLPIGVFMTLTQKTIYRSQAATPPITPSNTPTLKPTPTIVGNAPVITTNSLPAGIINRQYRATVEGYDLDVNNNLVMTASVLPVGMSIGQCRIRTKDVKSITCVISGKPTVAGSYNVTVNLSDSDNNTVSKVFSLTIN